MCVPPTEAWQEEEAILSTAGKGKSVSAHELEGQAPTLSLDSLGSFLRPFPGVANRQERGDKWEKGAQWSQRQTKRWGVHRRPPCATKTKRRGMAPSWRKESIEPSGDVSRTAARSSTRQENGGVESGGRRMTLGRHKDSRSLGGGN